jgi:outer membrane receptor protein involved in Fe transport
LNPSNEITFGWQGIYHQFQPYTFTIDGELRSTAQERHALEGGLFIANQQKISERLQLNYGVRLTSFSNIGAYTEKTFNAEMMSYLKLLTEVENFTIIILISNHALRQPIF